AGSMMGSGGMIIMDEDTCMVDIARYFIEFTQDESCGKCTPCRVGPRRRLETLERMCEGRGQTSDLDLLESLCDQVQNNSLCGLGQGAPTPVISTLKLFRAEYEAHINEKRCPARVCKALIRYEIQEDICTGCMVCGRNCPVNAIQGERRQAHTIDLETCIRCGICAQVCNFNAVAVLS
ncbi:MAG TPA: NADH-ubiquinone oxidoreductase-F iron-sulfur binding region domain-containing protein, partial [Anaerolineales bacterium]|nr:NADH-ubiquinone oxidoreductase-F iron-sulfur binding region domain-containing protein [Anaerolineales bacterium]